MFTTTNLKRVILGKKLIDAACLKTDTKPTTGIANGSKCIEMDTGKTFMFNEEDSEWEELPSSGGGGGGSSDFSIAHVKVNYTLDGEPVTPTLSDGQEVDIYNNELYIVISFYYGDVFGDGHLRFPVSDLGTAIQLNLPLYKDLKTDCGLIYINITGIGETSIYSSASGLTCTIVSGDATISDGHLFVTGDCEINVDWVTNDPGI